MYVWDPWWGRRSRASGHQAALLGSEGRSPQRLRLAAARGRDQMAKPVTQPLRKRDAVVPAQRAASAQWRGRAARGLRGVADLLAPAVVTPGRPTGAAAAATASRAAARRGDAMAIAMPVAVRAGRWSTRAVRLDAGVPALRFP